MELLSVRHDVILVGRHPVTLLWLTVILPLLLDGFSSVLTFLNAPSFFLSKSISLHGRMCQNHTTVRWHDLWSLTGCVSPLLCCGVMVLSQEVHWMTRKNLLGCLNRCTKKPSNLFLVNFNIIPDNHSIFTLRRHCCAPVLSAQKSIGFPSVSPLGFPSVSPWD